jgi:uncharacterized membrane protein
MQNPRYEGVDALRGLAMVWMTVFHFNFDLANLGYTQQNFYTDPLWTWQRVCILSLFLLCAGAGQAVASHQGQTWSRFWRRWRQIALCAVLVSVGSALMFPTSYIYFGVLHGMAVMLIIARLSIGLGRWLWLLGLLAILLKPAGEFLVGGGWLPLAFNARWLNWLGIISVKPFTEDYVPLVPWLGVLWWGVAAMQWVLRAPPARLRTQGLAHTLYDAWCAVRPLAMLRRQLARLGRWSLRYYMLHQPVLLAALSVWAALRH